MEIKIERSELLRGLYLANGIADKKLNLPILANVLLRTDGPDKLICAATDLNVTVVATLAAKVEAEGAITLAAKQIYDIVKGLGGKEVSLRRTDRNWAEVKCGRAEFKVVGMSDREYPKLPSSQIDTKPIDAAALRDMIAKTVFSVSTDESRQHLSGLFFESDGQTARMVSTDGHRLSKVERKAAGPVFPSGVLIPRKGVVEIGRIVDGHEGDCELGVRDGNLAVRVGQTMLVTKLSDSAFPPYDQVIPKHNDRKVFVAREQLLESLRRVSIMSPDTAAIKLSLERGKLTIQADSPELGNACERLDVDYKGAPFQAGFNWRYFIDVIEEIGSAEIVLELAGDLDPCVLRPSESRDYLGVVMPMRL